jgi:Flp pilus assembly protein TadG
MTTRTAPIWHGALRQLRRLLGRADGSAGVEFGFVAPGLIFLMVASLDLGLGIYQKTQVQGAAQMGAAYAAAKGFNAAAITAAVQSATSLTVTATPAPSQFCGCPGASGVVACACDAPCADGSSPGSYVTVTAQASYTPFVPYPVLPATYDLSSRATVRIQ